MYVQTAYTTQHTANSCPLTESRTQNERGKVQFLQRAQCSHCARCISYSNSVRPSVCLSVRHTPVLCQNDGT